MNLPGNAILYSAYLFAFTACSDPSGKLHHELVRQTDQEWLERVAKAVECGPPVGHWEFPWGTAWLALSNGEAGVTHYILMRVDDDPIYNYVGKLKYEMDVGDASAEVQLKGRLQIEHHEFGINESQIVLESVGYKINVGPYDIRELSSGQAGELTIVVAERQEEASNGDSP